MKIKNDLLSPVDGDPYLAGQPEVGEPDVATPTITKDKTDVDDGTDNPCKVVVFNDEIHSIQEVTEQIMKATGDKPQVAFEKTMQIHEKGKCVVYDGDKPDCVQVKDVLEEIDLSVEIQET